MKARKLSQLIIIGIAIAFVASHRTFHAQEKKEPKFQLAPVDAKNIKTDLYEVVFNQQLSAEDFEKELERIIMQYGAELAAPELVTSESQSESQKDKPKTKIVDLRWAVLRVPEVRARQIAEDKVIISVTQVYDVPFNIAPPSGFISFVQLKSNFAPPTASA
jgi:hypothetical protein